MDHQLNVNKIEKKKTHQVGSVSAKTIQKEPQGVNAFGINEEALRARARQRVFSDEKVNTEYISSEELKDYVAKNAPLPNFTPLSIEEEKSLKKEILQNMECIRQRKNDTSST